MTVEFDNIIGMLSSEEKAAWEGSASYRRVQSHRRLQKKRDGRDLVLSDEFEEFFEFLIKEESTKTNYELIRKAIEKLPVADRGFRKRGYKNNNIFNSLLVMAIKFDKDKDEKLIRLVGSLSPEIGFNAGGGPSDWKYPVRGLLYKGYSMPLILWFIKHSWYNEDFVVLPLNYERTGHNSDFAHLLYYDWTQARITERYSQEEIQTMQEAVKKRKDKLDDLRFKCRLHSLLAYKPKSLECGWDYAPDNPKFKPVGPEKKESKSLSGFSMFNRVGKGFSAAKSVLGVSF